MLKNVRMHGAARGSARAGARCLVPASCLVPRAWCAAARRDASEGGHVGAGMEPEPEPEPQIKLHQFTEEWQGVRVHVLFALFTGQ